MVEEKKIYPTFHDIPPREYMYIPTGTLDMGSPGKFGKTEVIHILISIGVLSIAFAFPITQNSFIHTLFRGFYPETIPFGIGLSFLAIVTAFIPHELSHKLMAQRYRLWAEYRMYPIGLIIALLASGLIGIVFAAPGAVIFRGESRPFETGRIAVAGPLANIIFGFITLLLFFLFADDSFIGITIGFICLINILLATFNLLPLQPLDGAKIVQWNAIIWSILFIFSTTLFAIFIPNIFSMFPTL